MLLSLNPAPCQRLSWLYVMWISAGLIREILL